jgi:hypothetical protein
MYVMTVVEKGAVPRELRRNFARMTKAALMAAAGYWHDRYRPLHFSKAAYYRYPIYQERENKKRPLYTTGETFRASEKRDFRGTANKVRAVYRLPKLNFFGSYRRVKRPDGTFEVQWQGPKTNMRREFQANNAMEARILQGVARKAFMEHVKVLQSLRRKEPVKGVSWR